MLRVLPAFEGRAYRLEMAWGVARADARQAQAAAESKLDPRRAGKPSSGGCSPPGTPFRPGGHRGHTLRTALREEGMEEGAIGNRTQARNRQSQEGAGKGVRSELSDERHNTSIIISNAIFACQHARFVKLNHRWNERDER